MKSPKRRMSTQKQFLTVSNGKMKKEKQMSLEFVEQEMNPMQSTGKI